MNGPRYDWAAVAAAQIVNTLSIDAGMCKAELFGKVLFIVLDAMYRAEADLFELNKEPSIN